jgi:hypothetical protein
MNPAQTNRETTGVYNGTGTLASQKFNVKAGQIDSFFRLNFGPIDGQQFSIQT